MNSFYFKRKARQCLKGNWQTALLITFFSGLFITAVNLIQSRFVPDPAVYLSYNVPERYLVDLLKVSDTVWLALGGVSLLALLLTPFLTLGSNHYFLCRLKGEELGFKGLFCRVGSFLKALGLFIVMGVRIFLWSLLLIVPGIIAAIRYSMAPYYLAEDPSIGIAEAIDRSKKAMKDKKAAYFMLQVSFYGWFLLSLLLQIFLQDISLVFALVVAQFTQLAISAYMNASCAAFFQTVSDPAGERKAYTEILRQMNQMGVDTSSMKQTLERFDQENPENEDDQSEPDDAAHGADTDDQDGDGRGDADS